MSEPDFYLSSTESKDFARVRSCWVESAIRCGERTDIYVVRVAPHYWKPRKPIGQIKLERFVIATRFEGESFWPEWDAVRSGVAVSVYDAPTEQIADGELIIGDAECMAWAEVYATEGEARKVEELKQLEDGREFIYVQLLNEGTTCYRRVPARPLSKGRYQIVHTDWYDPEDETWEFLPGAVVECEERELDGSVELVAVRELGS